MPFEWGIYVITNCVHPNNAALFNDNANESVRGILPVRDGADMRDNEKVSFHEYSRFLPSHFCSGS